LRRRRGLLRRRRGLLRRRRGLLRRRRGLLRRRRGLLRRRRGLLRRRRGLLRRCALSLGLVRCPECLPVLGPVETLSPYRSDAVPIKRCIATPSL
jgi:hypothetical protein